MSAEAAMPRSSRSAATTSDDDDDDAPAPAAKGDTALLGCREAVRSLKICRGPEQAEGERGQPGKSSHTGSDSFRLLSIV